MTSTKKTRERMGQVHPKKEKTMLFLKSVTLAGAICVAGCVSFSRPALPVSKAVPKPEQADKRLAADFVFSSGQRRARTRVDLPEAVRLSLAKLRLKPTSGAGGAAMLVAGCLMLDVL